MNNKVPHRWKWLISTLQDAGIEKPLIAGGAVRDLYMNKPAKDIDVFIHIDDLFSVLSTISRETLVGPTVVQVTPPVPIPTSNQTGFSALLNVLAATNNVGSVKPIDTHNVDAVCTDIKKLFKADHVQLLGNSDGVHYEYSRGRVIKGVYKITYSNDPTPVELIVLDIPAMDYFNDYFDVGICKAYFNGSRLHYSPECINDLKNHTITIVGKMDAHQLYTTLGKHVVKLLQYFPKYDVRIIPDRVLKK